MFLYPKIDAVLRISGVVVGLLFDGGLKCRGESDGGVEDLGFTFRVSLYLCTSLLFCGSGRYVGSYLGPVVRGIPGVYFGEDLPVEYLDLGVSG